MCREEELAIPEERERCLSGELDAVRKRIEELRK